MLLRSRVAASALGSILHPKAYQPIRLRPRPGESKRQQRQLKLQGSTGHRPSQHATTQGHVTRTPLHRPPESDGPIEPVSASSARLYVEGMKHLKTSPQRATDEDVPI